MIPATLSPQQSPSCSSSSSPLARSPAKRFKGRKYGVISSGDENEGEGYTPYRKLTSQELEKEEERVKKSLVFQTQQSEELSIGAGMGGEKEQLSEQDMFQSGPEEEQELIIDEDRRRSRSETPTTQPPPTPPRKGKSTSPSSSEPETESQSLLAQHKMEARKTLSIGQGRPTGNLKPPPGSRLSLKRKLTAKKPRQQKKTPVKIKMKFPEKKKVTDNAGTVSETIVVPDNFDFSENDDDFIGKLSTNISVMMQEKKKEKELAAAASAVPVPPPEDETVTMGNMITYERNSDSEREEESDEEIESRLRRLRKSSSSPRVSSPPAAAEEEEAPHPPPPRKGGKAKEKTKHLEAPRLKPSRPAPPPPKGRQRQPPITSQFPVVEQTQKSKTSNTSKAGKSTDSTPRPTNPRTVTPATAKNKESLPKLSTKQLKSLLTETKEKYSHLKEFFEVVKLDQTGFTITVQCMKCAPKKKTLNLTVRSFLSYKRHLRRFHNIFYDKFEKVYTGKDKEEEETGEEGSDNEDKEGESEEEEEGTEIEDTPVSSRRGKGLPRKKLGRKSASVAEFPSDMKLYGQLKKMKQRETIVDFFVDNFISFNVVESKSFNRMMKTGNSSFTPMSRRTLARLTTSRYSVFEKKLKK